MQVVATPISSQIPLASSTRVQVSLQCPPLDYEDSNPKTFTLHHPETRECPRALIISESWREALRAICLDSASPTPIAVAICRPKGAGKSTFSRLLVNTLALQDICQDSASPTPVVIAICGPKGAGKSSFSRLLVNSLISNAVPHPRVSYLDCDCGQPEFTPAGLVSLTIVETPLLGPPHVHAQQNPHYAHYLGDNSPQCDPETYVKSVLSLYHQHLEVQQDPSAISRPPLVINTHGWIRGLGFELLKQVLSEIKVTHVVQGPFWCNEGELCTASIRRVYSPISVNHQGEITAIGAASTAGLLPGGRNPGPMSPGGARGGSGASTHRITKPVDGRALRGSCESDDFWQTATAMASAVPYLVSLDDIDIDFMYGDVPASHVGKALNGAVVGLMAAKRTRSAQVDWEQPSSGDATLSRCLGIGVVRAVDMVKRQLFVLAPLTEARMEEVCSLKVGKTELPPSLLQTGDYVSPYISMFSLAADTTGGGAIKSRKNIGRRSLVNTI
eukprot:gene3490-13559_t